MTPPRAIVLLLALAIPASGAAPEGCPAAGSPAAGCRAEEDGTAMLQSRLARGEDDRTKYLQVILLPNVTGKLELEVRNWTRHLQPAAVDTVESDGDADALRDSLRELDMGAIIWYDLPELHPVGARQEAPSTTLRVDLSENAKTKLLETVEAARFSTDDIQVDAPVLIAECPWGDEAYAEAEKRKLEAIVEKDGLPLEISFAAT